MSDSYSHRLNEHKDMINGHKGPLSYQPVPISFELFTSGTKHHNQINKERVIYSDYNMWTNEIIRNPFRNGLDPQLKDESSSISDSSSLSTGSSLSSTNSSSSTPCCTSSYTQSSSPDLSMSDDYDFASLQHKKLNIPPSCFTHGCVCGHNFEFRDMAYETRKRRVTRFSGVTIKPKIQAITIGLKDKT